MLTILIYIFINNIYWIIKIPVRAICISGNHVSQRVNPSYCTRLKKDPDQKRRLSMFSGDTACPLVTPALCVFYFVNQLLQFLVFTHLAKVLS